MVLNARSCTWFDGQRKKEGLRKTLGLNWSPSSSLCVGCLEIGGIGKQLIEYSFSSQGQPRSAR